MDVIVAIIVALITGLGGALLIVHGFGFAKMFKGVPKKTALIGGIVLIGIFGWMYTSNYGGFSSALSQLGAPVPGAPTTPVPPGGFTGVSMEASSTDGKLYVALGSGSATDTVTLNFWENVDSNNAETRGDAAGAGTAGTAITDFTFTITVFNDSSDNRTLTMYTTIPTFRGASENSGTTYSVIQYSVDNSKYAMRLTPSGGSVRSEMCVFSVDGGSTKSITVDGTLDNPGSVQLDNGDFQDITIGITGVSETLNLHVVKAGEQKGSN